MTTEQKNVLRKIIYAVETGGQVYGQQDYSDFTEAYTNSSEEHAITIGAGQWYATEAQTLLKRIHDADTEAWNRLDNIGLWEQVQEADWSCFNISRNSQFSNLIVQLISSKTGVKCQDSLMDEQLATYADETLKMGVADARGQAMCVNFRHQGGQRAVTRILAKTKKPYTLDNLYTACQTDTGNQVGAYKSRQKFVYNALRTYFPESEDESMNAIDKLIQIAKNEIGYLEKASNSQLDSKTANAGENNYTKYWRDIKPDYQGQPWCAAFISWCVIKAFGLDTAKKLLKHWPYVYCPTMADLFTLNSNPKVGDIVIFYRNGVFAHTGIVIKVSGDQFWTVEGNTSGGSTIIANGGGVCQKSYYNSNLPGTKFCTPNYSLVKNTTPVSGSDTVKKQNTRAYIAQIKKDTKCYAKSNKNSPSKLFPKLKKGAVVEVMKYTETDSSGLKWYFVRIPHPTEGFVFEFVPKGTFTRISEIHK
nr:MAG TPA: PlyB like endolysin [Bacteriophage sp.]